MDRKVRANETTTALPEPLIGIAHVSRFTDFGY